MLHSPTTANRQGNNIRLHHSRFLCGHHFIFKTRMPVQISRSLYIKCWTRWNNELFKFENSQNQRLQRLFTYNYKWWLLISSFSLHIWMPIKLSTLILRLTYYDFSKVFLCYGIIWLKNLHNFGKISSFLSRLRMGTRFWNYCYNVVLSQ